MAVPHNGGLYIANSGKIFVKHCGSKEIILLKTLPYTGIGDLDTDGRDLAIFTVIFNSSCIEMFAAAFGH